MYLGTSHLSESAKALFTCTVVFTQPIPYGALNKRIAAKAALATDCADRFAPMSEKERIAIYQKNPEGFAKRTQPRRITRDES